MTLKVKGGSQAKFSGTCVVGEEEDNIGGQTPQGFEYSLDGQELECEIRKQGAGELKIILSGDGTRAVQRVNSTKATVRLAYDDGSVSFSTTSSSGSGKVSSSQVVSSSSFQKISISTSSNSE